MNSGELPRWCKSPFRNDWEFENVFTRPPDTGRESMGGRRQVQVLHRFRVAEFVWHVCWVDSQDYYGHGFFRYEDGRLIPVDEPPQE